MRLARLHTSRTINLGAAELGTGLALPVNLALPVGLVGCLLCLPLLRHMNSFGDEGVWFGAADRLAGGERLYVDFFEFLPPGSFLIVQGWFHLVGSSFAAARGLAVLTLSAIAVLAYLGCREASRSNLPSVMAVLFWLTASQPMWLTEVNHHWFTTLFSTAATLMVLRGCRAGSGSPAPPLLCGLAAGAAAMVTPTQGALTMLAAAVPLIGPGGVRRLAWLAAGCAAAPLLVLAYILHQDSLAAAVADVLVHTATRYASIQALPYGDGGTLLHLLVLIHPLNLLLLAGVCWQDWPGCRHDRMLRTAAAFALAGLHCGVLPAGPGAHRLLPDAAADRPLRRPPDPPPPHEAPPSSAPPQPPSSPGALRFPCWRRRPRPGRRPAPRAERRCSPTPTWRPSSRGWPPNPRRSVSSSTPICPCSPI